MSTFDDHATPLPQAAVRRPGEAELMDSAIDSRLQTDQAVYRPSSARDRMSQGRALAWEVVQTVLLTVAIFLSVRLVVQNFRVEGASMDPTLHSGQFLLINKISYARADDTPIEALVPKSQGGRSSIHYVFGGPSRGDIIVFRAPGQGDKDFIKRVIGMPGDTVQVKDGDVLINGVQLAEPYIVHHATYDFEAKKVPDDSFFVLGDNRPNSSDSHLGWFARADTVIGRAWVSYWPPSLWGLVDTETYSNVDR